MHSLDYVTTSESLKQELQERWARKEVDSVTLPDELAVLSGEPVLSLFLDEVSTKPVNKQGEGQPTLPRSPQHFRCGSRIVFIWKLSPLSLQRQFELSGSSVNSALEDNDTQ